MSRKRRPIDLKTVGNGGFIPNAGPPDQAVDPQGHVSLMGAIFDDLFSKGYKQAGTDKGRIHDTDWGADISELVSRAQPHDIRSFNLDTGLWVTTSVAIKLETLEVEVDDFGEICCWIYEES